MGVSMDLTDCVNIEQSGRAGRIKAKIGGDALSFEWEFGAAPVVVIIYVPSPNQWSARDAWRNLNRDEVLEALGHEVCRIKCRGCEHHFDDNLLELRDHSSRV
jgi:hypothetical protein